VDSNGNITVPYVGAIRAAARTPSEVQQAIIEALRTTPR
jgi:polysaccharide biosynthesis/export protein